MTELSPQPTLIERIERALLILAYFIELDGDVHLPMYLKFETELAELKAFVDAKTRASLRLAAFRQAKGINGDPSPALAISFADTTRKERRRST